MHTTEIKGKDNLYLTYGPVQSLATKVEKTIHYFVLDRIRLKSILIELFLACFPFALGCFF